jgi:hypothetical protein
VAVFTKIAIIAARSIVRNTRASTKSEIARSTLRAVGRGSDAIRLPPPEAPTLRRERFVASATYWAFVLCVVLTVLAILGGLALKSRVPWLVATKASFGGVMILEGLVLMLDWRGARRLLLHRIRSRYHHPERKETLFQSLYWRAAKPGLGVVGFAWFCLGLLVLGTSLFPHG